ncbi:MAG: RNA polymerase sigma factor [Muribaculaceae bacterium]|nr:RNA polymerase sigma factor [Muribaculaceae bacterium]
MEKTTQLILEILNTEKERLFQYASYRLYDIRDVEDVLQDIYVQILNNPQRFNKIENKRVYLYRVLSNKCTDCLRSNAKTKFIADISFDEYNLETLQSENFEEEFRMINHLLAILPQEQSNAIRLRHHSNLSFQEIADVMGVPLPTAKARYRYGLEKIRNELKKMNLL